MARSERMDLIGGSGRSGGVHAVRSEQKNQIGVTRAEGSEWRDFSG